MQGGRPSGAGLGTERTAYACKAPDICHRPLLRTIRMKSAVPMSDATATAAAMHPLHRHICCGLHHRPAAAWVDTVSCCPLSARAATAALNAARCVHCAIVACPLSMLAAQQAAVHILPGPAAGHLTCSGHRSRLPCCTADLRAQWSPLAESSRLHRTAGWP